MVLYELEVTVRIELVQAGVVSFNCTRYEAARLIERPTRLLLVVSPVLYVFVTLFTIPERI